MDGSSPKILLNKFSFTNYDYTKYVQEMNFGVSKGNSSR